MNSSPITELPPEIISHVLQYLPLASLLKYGRTSRKNYSAAILALQHLRLAIFPKNLQCDLAFITSNFKDIDAYTGYSLYDTPGLNLVKISSSLPLPERPSRSKRKAGGTSLPSPAEYRQRLFDLQNALAWTTLSTPTLIKLRCLTLHIYHITSLLLTETLATRFPCLKELHLNFYHPYVHDPCLPGGYWTNPTHLESSPIWDVFAGIGLRTPGSLKLRTLEKLTVERAGISSLQLQRWIACNPSIAELRLRNVLGVDKDFVRWLGTHHSDVAEKSSRPVTPQKLKTLALENCAALVMDTVEEFGWLDSLFVVNNSKASESSSGSSLESISFEDSMSVSATALCAYLELKQPNVQRVTLPRDRILVHRAYNRSPCKSLISLTCPVIHKVKQRTRPHMESTMSNHNSVGNIGTDLSHSITHFQELEIGVDPFDEDEDDSESSENERDVTDCPVSYLRVINQPGVGRRRNFRPSDIIEPDPNAF